MYAIVEIAGQQFKVEQDQQIFVHRLESKEGSKVDFDKVLFSMFNWEIFAVNDQSMSSKEFFKKQKMVKIKKTWFYKNNIKSFHDPNRSYLKKIEKEFRLNLWKIISADPNFYSFDGLSEFSESEIYSLVENDCKFFEKILNEVKPDILIIHTGGQKQMNILREMCKGRKTKILQFAPAKLGRRFQISSKYDVLDNVSEIPSISIDEKISKKYLITLQNRLNQLQSSPTWLFF